MEQKETIIITTVTEEVTYNEMTPRERVIYNYAQKKGYEHGIRHRIWGIIALAGFIIFSIYLFYKVIILSS